MTACDLEKFFILDNTNEITGHMHFWFMYIHIIVNTCMYYNFKDVNLSLMSPSFVWMSSRVYETVVRVINILFTPSFVALHIVKIFPALIP